MYAGQVEQIIPPELKFAMMRDVALERLFTRLMAARPTMDEIRLTVTDYYGVGDELSRRYRYYDTVRARQVFCFLAHRYTRFSMGQIGRHVGLSDHTTVLHAVRKIGKMSITMPLVTADLNQLRERIAERVLVRISRRS